MIVAYLGNFSVPYSTENHVKLTLEDMGHTVVPLQEDTVDVDQIVAAAGSANLFLWTRTPGMLKGNGFEMIQRVKALGIKSVSFHLDYYIGISRELAMEADPFWYTDFVFQPDGDHVPEFRAKGFNAYWSPPGVLKSATADVSPDLPKERDLIFVGSWQGYHPEWPWRRDLVTFLTSNYANFTPYPRPGEPAVREADLNQLYQTTKVSVGDSICSDTNKRYTTDRIFEATGRGSFIVYPAIPWLIDLFNGNLATYTPGDTESVRKAVDYWLDPANEAEREAKRTACHDVTARDHTYHNRFERIFNTITTGEEPYTWNPS